MAHPPPSPSPSSAQLFPLVSATMLPPPPPRTPRSSSGSSSLGKRKRDDEATDSGRSRQSSPHRSTASNAATATDFSEPTKRRVQERYPGTHCWHCRASPVHLCHVVPQRPTDFFDEQKRRGLLNLESVGHENNAVQLCPTCHANFDTLVQPGFVFFPSDIQYFIEFEMKDYDRRKHLRRTTGQSLTRMAPTAQAYLDYQVSAGHIVAPAVGGLYRRVVLRDYMQNCPFAHVVETPTRTGELFQPAQWHGDPMAALGRAFPASIITTSEMARKLRKPLHHLANLYKDNDEDLAGYQPEQLAVSPPTDMSFDGSAPEEASGRATRDAAEKNRTGQGNAEPDALDPPQARESPRTRAEEEQTGANENKERGDKSQAAPNAAPDEAHQHTPWNLLQADKTDDKALTPSLTDQPRPTPANNITRANISQWLISSSTSEPSVPPLLTSFAPLTLSQTPTLCEDEASSSSPAFEKPRGPQQQYRFQGRKSRSGEAEKEKCVNEGRRHSWKWGPGATTEDVVGFYVDVWNMPVCGGVFDAE